MQGREYDEDGNMRQWWNNVTLNTFKNRTACMENQVKDVSVVFVFYNIDKNPKLL